MKWRRSRKAAESGLATSGNLIWAAHYFDLSLAEQAELLHGLAPVLGRRAEILEKDSGH
jgi:hypothetical protein